MNFTSTDQALTWNTVTFDITTGKTTNSYLLPGYATVSVSASRDIATAKSSGSEGEYATDKGRKLCKIKIQIQMQGYEYEHFVQNILPAMNIVDAKTSSIIKCNHPQLQALRIQQMVIDSIDLPQPSEGLVIVEMSLMEYVAQPKVKPKPKPKDLTRLNIINTQALLDINVNLRNRDIATYDERHNIPGIGPLGPDKQSEKGKDLSEGEKLAQATARGEVFNPQLFSGQRG